MKSRGVSDDLLSALNAYAEFAERVGAAEDAARLKGLSARLSTEPLRSKQVDELVYEARGRAAFGIERQLSKRPEDTPETKALRAEFSERKSALGAALFPSPAVQATKVSVEGVDGVQGSIEIYGDAKSGRQIASRALEVVKRFSEAVFAGNLDAAYALSTSEMAESTTRARFAGALDRADQQYGGRAVSYTVESCTVLEDETSREEPNRDGAWPPRTPTRNKRALVRTFWFTKPEERRGRWVMFWITEEPDGYRIAKLNQYLQESRADRGSGCVY